MPIGKVAIAAQLIPKENPREFLPPGSEPHWYDWVAEHVLRSVSAGTPSQISFVTFNYDRSLEYALVEAMRASWGVGPEEAMKTLADVPIVHVHGALGHLGGWSATSRPFVELVSHQTVEVATAGIRIIHEVDIETAFGPAWTLLGEAEIICFLGCAYHRENMERLNVAQIAGPGGKWVIGSTCGMLPGEVYGAEHILQGRVTLRVGGGRDALEFLRSEPVALKMQG